MVSAFVRPESRLHSVGSVSGLPVRDPFAGLSSLQDEEFIISCLLVKPECVFAVSAILPEAEAFYSSSLRIIYQAHLDLVDAGDLPNLQSVSVRLQQTEQLEAIGGRTFLASLFDAGLSSVGVESNAKFVLSLWQRRKVVEAAAVIQTRAKDLQSSFEDVAIDSRALLSEAVRSPVSQTSDKVSDSLDQVRAVYNGEVQTMIPTGLLDVDRLIRGWSVGDLTILAGATSAGKTQFALNVAKLFAQTYDRPVVIFNCEMSRVQVINRLVSNLSGVDGERMLNEPESLTAQEISARDQALEALERLPIWIVDEPSPTPDFIRHKLREIQTQRGDIGMVVVDYLQLMSIKGGDGRNRTSELDRIARGCMAIAKETNCVFIALAQLSREVNKRQDKRPVIGDIRECGAIENHARRILFLYRDDYYNPESSDRGIVEVITQKNNHGRIGTCKMLYRFECSRFLDIATRF
jgi:replicative DNA helicase